MITLHRLGHAVEPFQLNPDLIVTVEATPDTVIALTTGAKIVVAESPDEVAAEMYRHQTEVLAGAMQRRREASAQPARSRRTPEGRFTPANGAMLHVASIEPEGA